MTTVAYEDQFTAATAGYALKALHGLGYRDQASTSSSVVLVGGLMAVILAATGATVQVNALLVNSSTGALLTGGSAKLQVRRASDNKILDWSGGTFKSSGWTTRQQAMTEVDSANDAGSYTYAFNLGSISGANADDTYFFRVDCTGALPFVGEIRVSPIADNLAVTPASATAMATAQTTLNTISTNVSAISPLTATQTAQAVWNALVSSYTTVGSFGLLLGSYATPPSAASIATQVWQTGLAGGGYTSGQAGYIIVTNLDTNVGSRLATSGYTAPLSSSATSAAVWNAATISYVGSGSFGALLGAYTAPLTTAGTAAAVWGALVASYAGAGSFGLLLGGYSAAPSASTVAAAVWATTGGLTSSVLAASAITALQAGLATSSAQSTAQSTLNTVSTEVSAIQGTSFTPGTDDLHSAHALLAGAATASALAADTAAIEAAITTATSPLATAAALASDTSAIEAAISALPAAPSASTVAAAVAGLSLASYTDPTTLGGAILRTRQWCTWTSTTLNKKLINTTTGKLEVYADDGTTLLDNPVLHDVTGSAVNPSAGEVAKLGA